VAEQTIKNMHFAKCFLGVDGIDIEFGLMAIEMETAKMDEMILERSQKRFILATSEKFERRNFIGYASLSMVNCIITDSDLPKSTLSQVAALDIALERA
jgi:DeoR/GlpR family transcriptional regulator of sugar metabolism